MNVESNWKDQKYDEIFNKTCQYVNNRKKMDEHFSIRDLEKMTESAYVRQGNDWVGKGLLKYIEDSATIAAFEHMLAEWKKEQTKS